MARTNRPATGTSRPSIGEGRAVVAVFVVYVLMMYQLPLVPLLAHVLHPPGHTHPPCTSTICYCEAGCQCGHHNTGHAEKGHDADSHQEKDPAETPSFSMCGTPGATTPFVVPVFDKALLTERVAPEPRAFPPLRFAGSPQAVLPQPLFDIFHPPRLG